MPETRRNLVLFLTLIMLTTPLAGCLGGGDDGGGDDSNDGGDTGDGGDGGTEFSDSDGDGVFDVVDQCADTPAGTTVDWSG